MNRVRRADGVNERVDLPVGLLPDLLAQRGVAVDRLVVVELVDPPVAGLLRLRPAVAIISLMRRSLMRPPSEVTSVMRAPKAVMVRRFSCEKASEKTTCSL